MSKTTNDNIDVDIYIYIYTMNIFSLVIYSVDYKLSVGNTVLPMLN